MTPLLEIADLAVAFPGPGDSTVQPVDGVSLTIRRGEMLALAGESGCGKSLTTLAVMRLVPPPGRIAAGSAIRLAGTELLALDAEVMRRVRGRRIGMVFQDPMAALNPVLSIGFQLRETIATHHAVSRREATERALALLAEVGIPHPTERLDAYAHQLSGGLRQRVLVALALAGEPDLLLADEPTTALDVTVQAQILDLLDALRVRRDMAVLLVTHDLSVAIGRADRIAVMYAGRIVEEAPAAQLAVAPAHPYTRGLLRSMPRLDRPVHRLTPIAGTVPAPGAWPAGCRFHPRCPDRRPECQRSLPPLHGIAADHRAACWLHLPAGAVAE